MTISRDYVKIRCGDLIGKEKRVKGRWSWIQPTIDCHLFFDYNECVSHKWNWIPVLYPSGRWLQSDFQWIKRFFLLKRRRRTRRIESTKNRGTRWRQGTVEISWSYGGLSIEWLQTVISGRNSVGSLNRE